ncbi:MAG: DUF456 domain-containing protein [Acidimicrobiia bacterium]|nr:DUF456 domain-containing protein [Acidimicrobiia bacterium]
MEPNVVEVFVTVLVGCAMLGALLGTVVPAFPGVVLAWLAALAFGFVVGFDRAGIAFMTTITMLAGANYVAMVRIPQKATMARGARRSSVVAGAVGAIAGFFLIPIIGFVIGGAAGVFGAEWFSKRDTPAAVESTKGVLIGFGVSSLIQLAAGILIAIVWAVWVVWRFDVV